MRLVPIIRVKLAGAPYDVTVEPDSLRHTGQRLRAMGIDARRIAVVSDDVVAALHLPALVQSLREGQFEVIEAIVPAGEEHKTIATLGPVYDRILGAGIDRGTPLVALGGGVVGDIAGFVAATVLRGVPFVQVPTTLLAMVDASVGGKTGVNHAVGKNLIGAFHQPRGVLIDPTVLATLPPNELRNGLAECIKHEIIRDADGFARLEQNLTRALRLDSGYLTELIAHNVSIKSRIVESDPLEHSERTHLNFGHTFGHAIERTSRYEYSHGESVALGMIAACRAARDLKLLDDASVRRVRSLIAAAGLPTGKMNLSHEAIIAAMSFDKKIRDGRLRLILPDRIGHVVIRDDVPADVVGNAVASLAE